MKYGFFLWCLVHLFFGELSAQPLYPGLTGPSLQLQLRTDYYPNSVYSYNRSRDTLYAVIDIRLDTVECVYTGYKGVYRSGDGVPRTVMNNQNINAEHTWPQSFFNSNMPMMSDMHHLFPSWSIANSTRNNNPFANIENHLVTSWLFNGRSTKSIPALDSIPMFSKYFGSRFEPRDEHKGNVARAMFYFWTIYQADDAIVNDETDNAAWFTPMIETLYEWHKADPADEREIARSELIAQHQGKINPFIADSSLIHRAFFQGQDNPLVEPIHTSTYPEQIVITQYYEGVSFNKWIQITNVGQFTYNFDANPLYVLMYSNPTGDPTGNPSSTYALTGTLAPDSSIVLRNSQAALPNYVSGINSGVCGFNGDDPVVLSRSNGAAGWNARTDVFGYTSGGNFAMDVSYTRKPDKLVASRTWNPADWELHTLAAVNEAQAGENRRIGTFSGERSITLTGTQGWRFLSIPSSEKSYKEVFASIWTQGSVDSKMPNATPHIYRFREDLNQFEAIADLNEMPVRGEGLAMYIYSDDDLDSVSNAFPKALRFARETTAASAFSFDVSAQQAGWNLLGNPYPFALDWDHASWTKENLSNTITIWDNDLKAYKSWNGLVGTNGMINGIIPAYQSFWVYAGANPELSVHPDAKVTDVQMHKGFSNTFSSVSTIRIRKGFEETVLVFHPNGMLGADPFDAVLPSSFDQAPPLAMYYNDQPYAILSLPVEVDAPFSVQLQGVVHEGQISISNNSAYSPKLVQRDGLYFIDLGDVVTSIENDKPWTMKLHQNFPNPFNPVTTIQFELAQSGVVDLTVYNVLGQRVQQLVSGPRSAGVHAVQFDASRLASGVYWYKLSAANGQFVKSMTLIK